MAELFPSETGVVRFTALFVASGVRAVALPSARENPTGMASADDERKHQKHQHAVGLTRTGWGNSLSGGHEGGGHEAARKGRCLPPTAFPIPEGDL